MGLSTHSITNGGLMSECNALSQNLTSPLALPWTDLSPLAAKLTKKLWVSPQEFLTVTHADTLAEWAIHASQIWRPRLPIGTRRGPKQVYRDSSVLILSLVQVAWQMTYEESVDYFRAHPAIAQVAGFPTGRVISSGQYWTRRRELGSIPYWLFFTRTLG